MFISIDVYKSHVDYKVEDLRKTAELIKNSKKSYRRN